MSELTLVILKIAFLAVLWLFVFIVVYALRSDLFGPAVTKVPQKPAAPPSSPDAVTSMVAATPAATKPAKPAGATRESASRIVITGGPKAGLELDLAPTGLTIGRSSGSGLQIKDDYTSNSHAKIMLWRNEWMVQDLDSTNGTFLDGMRVTAPTPIPVNTPLRIGTTTFELRR